MMPACLKRVIYCREEKMPIKEQAIELIMSLPDDCTLEDIQYHLYVRAKVERGIRAIDEGRVVSQEEAEKKVKEWVKSYTQS
jgi:predicted transcriptional regulator